MFGLKQAELPRIFFVRTFPNLPLGCAGCRGRVRHRCGGLRLPQRRNCFLRRAQDRKPFALQQGMEPVTLRRRPPQPGLDESRAALPCALVAFAFALRGQEVGGTRTLGDGLFRFHQGWWVAPTLAPARQPSRDPASRPVALPNLH